MKKPAFLGSVLVLLGSVALLASISWVRSSGPGGDGVLAQLALADGSEYMLTQQWNDWTEPYTVSFWLRPLGADWGWCYVDHEAFRWRKASLHHDPDRRSIQVLNDGQIEAELLLETSTFTLRGPRKRELPAPQERVDPPFPFPTSG